MGNVPSTCRLFKPSLAEFAKRHALHCVHRCMNVAGCNSAPPPCGRTSPGPSCYPRSPQWRQPLLHHFLHHSILDHRTQAPGRYSDEYDCIYVYNSSIVRLWKPINPCSTTMMCIGFRTELHGADHRNTSLRSA